MSGFLPVLRLQLPWAGGDVPLAGTDGRLGISSETGKVGQAHGPVRVDMVLRLHYCSRGSGLVDHFSNQRGWEQAAPPETLWEISHECKDEGSVGRSGWSVRLCG